MTSEHRRKKPLTVPRPDHIKKGRGGSRRGNSAGQEDSVAPAVTAMMTARPPIYAG